MTPQPHITAQILPFCRPEGVRHYLTIRDRIDALTWGEAGPGKRYQLKIIDVSGDERTELGSVINIYRTGERMPCCTIVREHWQLRAWWSADGRNIGAVTTVRAALEALLAEDEMASRLTR